MRPLLHITMAISCQSSRGCDVTVMDSEGWGGAWWRAQARHDMTWQDTAYTSIGGQ